MLPPCLARLGRVLPLVPATFLFAGCMDSSIDYGDVDLKMKVNVDGLAVKFGNTEKIRMVDILEPDGDVKVDAGGLYYIVEEGETSFDFRVNAVEADVDANRMSVRKDFGQHIWDEVMEVVAGLAQVDPVIAAQYPDIKAGRIPFEVKKEHYPNPEYIDFAQTEPFKLDIQWDDAVKQISWVDLKDLRFNIRLVLNDDAKDKFLFRGREGLVVSLPSYVKSPQVVDGKVRISDEEYRTGRPELELADVTIDALEFQKALQRGESPEGEFGIEGRLKFELARAFTVQGAPQAHISLLVRVNDKDRDRVKATAVRGIFAPAINPTITPFKVKSQLPDFLNDDDVRLNVGNATLRLDADLRDIPTDATIRDAGLIASTAGNDDVKITIARTPVTLTAGRQNRIYFYEGAEPYDVEAISSTAQRSVVSDFHTLVTTVPDEVKVQLDGGVVQLSGEETEITFGRDYKAKVDYKLLVPFTFGTGMTIKYKDESDELDLDMDDFEASGIALTVRADVASTVPLDLDMVVEPLDEAGKRLEGVEVSVTHIPAAKDGAELVSPLTATLTAPNPDLFRRLKRMRYTVQAKAGQNVAGAQLRSDQYLQIRNARITVKGAMVGDFN